MWDRGRITMKVRKGFVTNSSSSSFLIGYNDLDILLDEIYDKMGLKRGSVHNDSVNRFVGELVQCKMTKRQLNKYLDNLPNTLLYDFHRFRIQYKGKLLSKYDYRELKDTNTEVGRFWYQTRLQIAKDIKVKAEKYKKFIFMTISSCDVCVPTEKDIERDVFAKLSGLLFVEDNH